MHRHRLAALTLACSLFSVPAATTNSFTIAIGDTVTNGLPSLGAGVIDGAGDEDRYTLAVTNAQRVYFHNQQRSVQLYWQLSEPGGAQVFNTQLWDTEPGVFSLVTTGAYTIRVYGSSGATGTYAFKLWPVVTQSFNIDIGDTVSTNLPGIGAGWLDQPGAVDTFTFTATNSQRVYFDTQLQVWQIFWRLLDPDGIEVFSNHFWDSEPGTVALPKTGTYTIRVYGGGDTTGYYRFKLWPVGTAPTFGIAVGDTVSSNNPAAGAGYIETPGATDLYTFTATNGQRVYFDTQLQVWQIFWQLLDPDGIEIFNKHFWDAEPGTLTLPKAGTYTIRVYGGGETTGAYSFKLWSIPPTDRFNIAVGDTVSSNTPAGAGQIETPGATDEYFLTNAAGQTVFFNAQGSTPAYTLRWSVYDALGNRLFDKWLNEADPGYITLPVAGTNRVVLYGSGDATGTGTFKLWNVPLPGVLGIALGDTITNNFPTLGAGNIETPGAEDYYAFTNAPGQVVFLEVLSWSGNLLWSLTDAPGDRIFNNWISSGSPGLITLPAAGTNIVRVYGSGGATGPYGVRIWSVPSPDTFTIAVGDTANTNTPGAGSGRIEQPGAEDLYWFTNAPGQAVYLDMLTSNNALRWSLFNARGDRLYDDYLYGDAGKFTLPYGGTNRIRVYGIGASTGTYSFAITNATPDAVTLSPVDRFVVSLDTSISNGVPGLGAGNIETNGAQDIYDFSAAGGDILFIEDFFNTGNAVRIDLYDPNGNFINWEWLSGYPDIGRYRLPISGTYRCVCYGNGSATSTYQVRLWKVTPQRFNIGFSQIVSNSLPAAGAGQIENPGVLDVFTFAGTAGHTVFMEDFSSTDGQIRYFLYDPNGEYLNWEWLNGWPDISRLTLAETGDYRIEVWGHGNATGTYSFRLWYEPANSFTLALGDIVQSNAPAAGAGFLATPGEVDTYYLTVPANQLVLFEDFGSDGNQVRLDAYDPNGNFLFWEWLNGGNDLWRRQLSSAGTYRLVLYGNGQATGAYSFRVRALPADHIFNITFDTIVTNGVPWSGAGNLEQPGAQDTYYFTAAPGQIVYFEDFGAQTPINWILYDAAGAIIFNDRLDGGDPGRRQLTRGGTYMLVVYPAGASTNYVGTYSFRIRSVPPDQFFQIAIGDTVTNGFPAAGAGNLEAAGAYDVYTFTSPAGQLIYFEDLGGQTAINWIIYDETGATILNDRLDDGDPGRYLLARGGTYTIYVYPAGASASYLGTYAFRLRPMPPDDRFSIAIGDVVENGRPGPGAGNLEMPGAYDIYTFTAPAGQLVYFEDLGGQTAINWIIYDESGATILNDRLDDGDPGARTLTLGGTYTIYVYPAGASVDWIGTYSFRIWGASPYITAQPQSQRGVAGQTQVLSVTASSPFRPLSYQWFHSGTNLPTATNSILTLNNAAPAQAGEYFVIVTNTYGAATSQIATLTLDSSELFITAFTPRGPVPAGVSSLRVQFNEAINAATFTPADVVLRSPTGVVSSASFTISPVDAQTFDVLIPTQTASGTYTVEIGPGITNLSGRPMTGGVFVPVYAADFETGVGAEWSRLDSLANSVTTAFLGNFASESVTLTLSGLPSHDRLRLKWDLLVLDSWDGENGGPDTWGFNIADVTYPAFEYSFNNYPATNQPQTFPGYPTIGVSNFAANAYADSIYRDLQRDYAHTNSTLTVSFYGKNLQVLSDESWGLDNVRVLTTTPSNGLFTASFTIDAAPPTVTGFTPAGASLTPVDHADVTFDQDIQLGTFTTNDVQITGATGSIAPTSLVRLSNATYRVTFASQRYNSAYTVVIGPNILDLAGNAMSAPATNTFHILTPPLITTHPTSQTIVRNNNVTFSVVANSTPPTSYQWDYKGAPIANATNSTLALFNLQTNHSGSYRVTVSDAGGPTTSSTATLTVLQNYGPFIAEAQAARPTVPPVPGNGVFIELFNGIGGGPAPTSELLTNRVPSGTTLSPVIDFPHPGGTINVGSSFNNFFQDTTTPPDSVLGLAAANFVLRHTFYLAVRHDYDRHPETPEIDLSLGVGSDDGFYLLVGTNFIGQAGDRGFSYSWMDVSFANEGLYPITLLYAANAAGASGLEMSWQVGTNAAQIIPQSVLYISPDLGDRLITFEEFPVNTVLSNQYAPTGVVFRTISGQLQITTNFPANFVPVSPRSVFADLRTNPAEPGEVELTFVDPATGDPATTDFLNFFVIDAETNGATVLAYDWLNQLVFSNAYHGGGAAQELVNINHRGLARVRVTLGQGNDTAAIDNIALTAPLSRSDLAVEILSVPANAQAGQLVPVIWRVTNRGLHATTAPWTETLSVSDDTLLGNDQALGIFTVTNTLSPGASLTRTQTVAVPFNGPAGNVYFVVSASSSEPAGEYDYGNNTAIASNGTTIPLVLALDIPNHQFPENAPAGSVLGNVSRNGSRTAALTVTLGSSDTGAATVPATVQIPSGQSSATFAITPVPDGVPTLDKPVTISASAGGYASASSNVVVLNIDQPGLGLSILNSTLLEGQSSSATVARTGSSSEPLLVVLASSSAGQLNVPASVTIPAGVVGVMFFVTASQDLNLEPNITYTVTALATGFTPASAAVTVVDDDIPVATLTLSRTNVSEGDGPNAASATLSLPTASTLPITFALASSNPAKLQVPASITIPAGASSVVFSIAALDNALVDGPHDVSITATLLSTVGGQPLPPALTASVRVEDNDGPTLSLTMAHHLVAEGVTNATTATVTRNVVTNAPLLVTLTSSDIGEAVTPPTVLIPANQSSANFSINSLNDGVTDGNKSVTITATATSFTPGSDTLVVSDVNLPDLVISSLSAPTNALTETFFSLTYRESNLGFAAATGAWSQLLFLSRDRVLDTNDQVLGQFTFAGTMNPGLFFERTVTFRLPREPGDYWVIAQSDPSNAVVEVLEDNNVTVASTPITVSAAYSATVHTDFTQGLAGTPVLMEGTATRVGGAPATFELVNIYVKVRETVRVLGALADEFGHFSATFRPLLGESGHYTIGAAHPGQTDAPVQDAFDLLGMKFDPASVSHVLSAQTSVTNTVTLTNRSEIPLTGLTTTVLNAPAGVTINATVPGSLPGGAGTPVQYTITSTANASSAGTVTLRVTSAEGTHTDLAIDLRVEARVPQLVATPGSLTAGMLRGAQTIVSFTVRNDGGEASGPVDVLLPAADWLHMATVSPLPSLVPGASNLVTLLLTPAADLALTDYRGTIVLDGANTSLSVPFSFRALSDGLGVVRVEAVDEYTYYAEGAPRVTNATVRLKDPATGDVLTNGVTDAQGSCVLTNVREGYYTLEVTATNHNDFRGTILVSAGATNEAQAFLPRQTVQYIWTVVPTEIEDRTRITIETVFETVVPIPVVTVSPTLIDLNEIQQEVSQIDLVITNHGLVAAQSIRIGFGSNAEWQFTPLVTELGDLPALSSFTVPVTIRHLTSGASAAPAKARASASDAGGGGCGISAQVLWDLICGTNRHTYAVPVAIPGNCGGGAGAVYACCGAGSGGVINPVTFSSSGLNLCDPCGQEIAQALLECIIGFLPIPDVIGCAMGAYECASEPSVLGCAGAIVTCLAAAGREVPGLGQVISALQCADGLLSACGGPGLAGPLGGGGGPSASPRRVSTKSATSPVLNYPGMDDVIEHARRVDTYRALYASLLGNDPAWYSPNQGTNFGVWLQQFAATITTNSDAGQHVSASEQAALLTGTFPDGVAASNLVTFIERWNRTMDYEALGIRELSQVPGGQSTDFITRSAYSNAVVKMNQAIALDQAQGYADALIGFKASTDRLRQILTASANSGGVCARVKLRLNQDLVLTRDAFNATLEIINNSGTSLNGISVDLLAKNEAGDVTTSFFAIRLPELTGLSDVSGAGVVVSGTSGKASWILIPTDDAAPAVQTAYFVSGTLRYVQDGVTVTVPLAPVRITVFPNPSLALTYFHERDVRSDDPFTPQIEPSIPYSLAVMVKNNGAGQAKNVRISSGKPEIIENEKGLLIGFDIIATEVAGQGLTPSLTADFGNIASGGIGLARWLFKSTLQGQFISYSATFENLSDLGSDKLSLVDSVEIHELIHIVRAGGAFEDGLPDFLVNDFNDFDALPDTLYLSDGSIAPVTALTNVTANGLVTPGNLTVTLTTPAQVGWLYLRANDPGQGQYRLVRVLRSDSTELRLGDNVWTSDRTFIAGGARPVYENKLHLFDRDSTGQYTLEYAPLAATDLTAPVSAIAPLPTNSYAQIPLTWSGQDESGGSGLAFFDVFVSVDGSAFTRWLNHTPAAGAVYQGELGRAYAFYTVALDNAGNAEAAPLTPDAQTTVNRTNSEPSFAGNATLTIDEGATAVIDLPASDPDLPTQTLHYTLGAGAPAGASVHPNTGRITWPTGEGNGPSTNVFTVIATDNGVPALSTTSSVTVVVNEVNSAPTLASIRNYTINEGFELVVTNVAADSDLPRNTLSFALGAGAPLGATVNPASGIFRWRPTETQGPSTNPIAVIVSDNGVPPLSATQRFTVIVRDSLSDCVVSLGSTNVLAGESNMVPIVLRSGLDLARLHLLVETRPSHLRDFNLRPVSPEVVEALLVSVETNQFEITLTLDPLQAVPGARELAQLGFLSISNMHSAIVPLLPLELVATRSTGATVTSRRAVAGRVIVVDREPVLVGDDLRFGALWLYGRPGVSYGLEFNTNLLWSAWEFIGTVIATNPAQLVPGMSVTNPAKFFRVKE